MEAIRTVIGLILASGLCVVSIACNYRFGTHLAAGFDGQIYGVLGGVADGLKALLPLAITASYAARQFGRASAGTVLFVIFSTYSLASALGLYSLSREATVGDAKADKVAYEMAVSERTSFKDRLIVLGKVRTVGVVEGDIKAATMNRLWRRTTECTDATRPDSRLFCDAYARLEGELEGAKEAGRLHHELKILGAKIDGMDLAKVMSEADPQAEALSRLTGYPPETIRTGLAVLVALLVELGSGLGLWVVATSRSSKDTKDIQRTSRTAVRYSRKMKYQTKPKTPMNTRAYPTANNGEIVEMFADSALVKKPKAEIAASDLYASFTEWAMRNKLTPITNTQFGRTLSVLGYRKEKRGGRVRYLDIELGTMH